MPATRMTIVNEDGGRLRLVMHRRGQPAYVPAVAHGQQRQQRNQSVLQSVSPQWRGRSLFYQLKGTVNRRLGDEVLDG